MKVNIKGVVNFRELGGIPTVNGKVIKRGYFYRCGELGGMKDKQKAQFDKLNIANIFDYRDKDEIQDSVDYTSNAFYRHIPAITDTKGMPMIPKQVKKYVIKVTEEEALSAAKHFSETYSEVPFGSEAYGETFNAINEFKPILFHCTAGKDRTGIFAALLLKTLGVSDDEIIKDFMLSNKYRWYDNYKLLVLMTLFIRNKWARYLYKKVSFVHENNIIRALGAIEGKYGTIENYLDKEYGITLEQIQKWREFYLEERENA